LIIADFRATARNPLQSSIRNLSSEIPYWLPLSNSLPAQMLMPPAMLRPYEWSVTPAHDQNDFDIAQRTGLQHGFWVVLGTLSVLRSNALATATAIRETLKRLSTEFPAGLEFRVIYDPTVFIQESIDSVTHTIYEAVGLVVIVVMVFLQSWRASLKSQRKWFLNFQSSRHAAHLHHPRRRK